MSSSNDNPVGASKKALSEATEVIANDPELNVSYSVDPSGVSGDAMRLPQVSRRMTREEVMLARGTARKCSQREPKVRLSNLNTVSFLLAINTFAATSSFASEANRFFAFPEERSTREKAAFCVTVQAANGQAMDQAAELIKHLGNGSGPVVSERIVRAVGGQTEYDIALSEAIHWEPSANSLSQTYYYPMMANDGAPYTVHEGQILLSAFTRCLSFFEQVEKEQ